MPRFRLIVFAAIALLPALPATLGAAKNKAKPADGAGFNITLSATLADVAHAVDEVSADPILYGTYVYERDKILVGARQVDSSSAFGNEPPQGTVFYKVLDGVLAPRYFKDTEDSGTITIRYVVRQLSPTSVSIYINSVFVESARRAVHPSEGAVESAEFGQIQQHLNRIQAHEKEAQQDAREAAKEADQAAHPSPLPPPPSAPALSANSAGPSLTNLTTPSSNSPSSGPFSSPNREDVGPPPSPDSVAELEQRVNRLRHQVEARVKAPGAPLKSAPFHTATTIQTVPVDSEVAVVILTAYWYGVQTTDGHTGWIQRSQLEPLP